MRKTSQAEQTRLRQAVGVYLKTAEKFIKSGEFKKALEQVEQAQKLDPKNAYAHAYKERILELQHEEAKKRSAGEILAAQDREIEQRKLAEEAERKRKEAEEKKLREEEEARLRADEGARKGREEEERKQKEKEQRLKEHLSHANRYLEEGNFEIALDETEKALQLDPKHPDANQLDTRIHQEKLEKAERDKELRRKEEAEVAKLRAAMTEIDRHVATAREFLEREEFEEAVDSVEKALQLDPRHEVSIQLEEEIRKLKMEEYLRKAEEKIKRMEADEKRRELLREIQQFLVRAEVFYSSGKFEKALDEIIHALGLDSTHPQAKELAAKIH
ncbi:MAG: hypothetical protein V3U69_04705, partial [Bacteroidota bacterium]